MTSPCDVPVRCPLATCPCDVELLTSPAFVELKRKVTGPIRAETMKAAAVPSPGP